jgi:thiol-disulfide isomerase/thioredoxin
MTERLLNLIPLFLLGAIVLIPFLCLFLYKKRKVRTCMVFSHLWCMIAFLVLGIFLLHTVRRNFSERQRDAHDATNLLRIARSLRQGDTENSIKGLDSLMANTLHRTASDISDDKMAKLAPKVLMIWQEFKEYYDNYNVEATGGMVPHVRRKLEHVPWRDMQLAIKKFERIYGSGKIATAPGVNIKSWITPAIPDEELSNKVILLDFWNIHCGPCVKSLPELQKLHNKYKERGVTVISCAGGNKQETKKFLDKHGYSFPAGMASNQMIHDYAIRGNPSYFMIDRNGNLVWGPEHRLPTDEELEKNLGDGKLK